MGTRDDEYDYLFKGINIVIKMKILIVIKW